MKYIIKSDGEKERFDKRKLRASIIQAGATEELADEVIHKFSDHTHDDLTTEEITKIIIRFLKKDKRLTARYDLRRAIMELGPAGYSFEAYFARVLEEHGFTIDKNHYFKGKNITHEVDIKAKRKRTHMIECKYHNKLGIKTRVKDPLYVYARFLDLKKDFDAPWLATNTKCTDDALNYAKGVGMRVTAWDYPKGFSLRELICNTDLYPITVLQNVSRNSKENLFKCGIYLVKDLVQTDPKRLVKKAGFLEHYAHRIISEAKEILGSHSLK